MQLKQIKENESDTKLTVKELATYFTIVRLRFLFNFPVVKQKYLQY